MVFLSRRSALSFSLALAVCLPASVAMASQVWQATCVKCGHQSKHGSKQSDQCTRGINGKNCGGNIVWVQLK